MAFLNRRVGPPEVELHFWTGAVGGDQSLIDVVSGLAARAVIVGVVAGNLVLVDVHGTTRTYTPAKIVACGGIIRGDWAQATAAGSAAHTLIAWW